ncbi:glycosyltransferase [Marinimicrobium sp. LS-A18]|uniref:glycosyltransferase n=1 Tax=Marinimicrobium sp. LS-A18 TaxID=1381596 RepID=UPI0004664969|nr:glycosyltransferase [Marinimicrobium sp. LS-A18]
MINLLRHFSVSHRAKGRDYALYAMLIDESWYRKQYGDVIPAHMSALSHYSTYGVRLRFDPSAFFSTEEYLDQCPELYTSGENPLWHFVTKGQYQGVAVKPSHLFQPNDYPPALARQSARKLEMKLWGGFSGEVWPVLRSRLVVPSARASDRSYAAWALARWSAFHKDYSAALSFLSWRRWIDGEALKHKAQVLLEVDCLIRLGREGEAYDRLRAARKGAANDADLLLSLSNVFVNGVGDKVREQRLRAVNQVLTHHGFTPLALRNREEPLSIFNLKGAAQSAGRCEEAKVSILMPAYNAGAQIELAIRSLQEQSWTNLEILVADDCSSDDTRSRVEALAKSDPRVRLIALEHNGGAYAARNAALEQASGDVITVHDSDDWSHPQKLEVQVRHLLNQPSAVATITDWARAREDLYFTGTFRAHGSLVSENTSSLMFRREAVEHLGGWDLARTSADSEYVLRLRRVFGDDAVVRLHRGVPLAFALDQETSLTRTPVTHAKTLFYGARREYREAASAWHELASSEELKLPLSANDRPFPIPTVMRTKNRDEVRHYDIVVIADFNLSGGAFVSTMNYVDAAIAQGKRVAIFHWRRADLDVETPLKPVLRQRAGRGDFDILAAGESVKSEVVLVGYPVVLNYRLDMVPEIITKHFIILVNQMASRLTTGEDPQYDPRRVGENVRALFSVAPVWVPISGLVQRLMREDERYPEPHFDIWNPLLNVDNWCLTRVNWRGDQRPMPVVGRHARDHYTKWPGTAEALAAAYCVNRDCEVRLLGGADHALSILGAHPDNWHVLEFADSTYDFLQELDFFVHYPHEHYIEEFGRAVLEAMGLGIPAILPPVFKETFGDFACYAEPDEVWQVIESLWGDRQAYQAASERGLQFVREHARYDVLNRRLEKLNEQVTYEG